MNKFNQLSPLKKWVISNKYYIKTTDPKEKKADPTHYLLDGGMWKIPKGEYPEFLRLLSTDLQNNEKHYICENRTNVFKFVCDLDFYEPEDTGIISVSQVEVIVEVIQKVVLEYFGNQKVIICSSDSKNVNINDNSFIKCGFHLIWPKIWLTNITAKKIRTLFIENLIEKFAERPEYNTWSDVVDMAIYEANGLRMVGCRKMVLCKTCKNKKEFRENCVTCNGYGRIDENRVYKPASVLPHDEIYLKSISDYYVMLLETSLYNYSDIPESPLLLELTVELIEKKKPKTVKQDELTSKIELFIKKSFKETHSKIKIKKITKSEDNLCYYIDPNDNFCINVNRSHTSSSIYFQIKPTGITQRCYCKKETTNGRLFGPCKEFTSTEIKISPQFRTILFGQLTLKGPGRKTKKIVNCAINRSNNSSSLDLSIIQNNSDIVKNNKTMCLQNCKNILTQLESDLLS